MKEGFINLELTSFKPVKNSAITFELNYQEYEHKILIKCDK
jgi:hypothetical protein